MKKQKKVYLNVLRKEKVPLGVWDIEEWELLIEDGPSFKSSCELLLPLNKFLVDFEPFFLKKTGFLKLDPNDGTLFIAIQKKNKSNSTLMVKENTLFEKSLFDGVFNTKYLLKVISSFFLGAVQSYAPTSTEDARYIDNLKNKLQHILESISND